MSVDMFLEFDKSASITGESIDKGHPSTIQVTSFSFGAEMPVSVEQGTGLGAGKVKFNEFAFKMPSSLASASCFKNMYKGTHIPAATLYLRKAGGGQKDYMVFSFKELMVNKTAASATSATLAGTSKRTPSGSSNHIRRFARRSGVSLNGRECRYLAWKVPKRPCGNLRTALQIKELSARKNGAGGSDAACTACVPEIVVVDGKVVEDRCKREKIICMKTG